MSLDESISTLSTQDQMKEAVKEKALGILKMDEKVKRLSNDKRN